MLRFTIDFAKTLYKPTRPSDVNEFLRKYTDSKMPFFFKYAKGYASHMPINGSLVNKLHKFVKNKRLHFKEFSTFEHRKLMSDPNVRIDEGLVDLYMKLSREYHFQINRDENGDDNVSYVRKICKDKLRRSSGSDRLIADILIQYLYGETNSKYKKLLWLCYGDTILENLQRNVDTSMGVCMNCGKRFQKAEPNHQYCDRCFLEKTKRATQVVKTCKDCGTAFLVDKSVRNKPRCDRCQAEHRRRYEREKKRSQKAKKEIFPMF